METSLQNTSKSNSRRSKDHHLRTSATSPPPPPPLLPSSTHSCDSDASPSAEELDSRVSVSQNDECMPMRRRQSIGQECTGASMCERSIGCEESSGKGCKRAPGCEKFVSLQSLASVRKRSADTERVLEPDNDNVTRLHIGKRVRTDYHHIKGNISEQSIKLALKDKLDVDGMVVSIAARKGPGSDKKNRGNGDDHFHKTACAQAEPMGAVGREGLQEEKNASKASPRSADHGGDRREKKDVSVGRLPLKKAFKTMRALTDVGNSRDFTVKKVEHGSSVGGENMGYREKRSPSQSSGGGAEYEKDLQVNGTGVHDFPIKFSHISKRARSHRDRRSYEKLASTGGQQEDGGVKLKEAGKQEEFLVSEVGGERNSTTDFDGEAREDDGGASSKGADATEELPTKKEESMEDSFSTCPYSDKVKDTIERREVHMKSESHLAAEGDSKGQHATVWDRAHNRDLNMRDNINCNVGMAVGIEPPGEMSQEASAKESHENRRTVVSHEDGGKSHRGCNRRGHTMVHSALGEQGNKRVQSTACACDTSVAMEMCETSQGESKFLDEGPVGQKNHAHQCPVDGELDTGKQLTLSLFAKGTEAQGEVKGLTMKGDLERGKHLQGPLNGGVDGSGGNVGEHIGYGHTEMPSRVGPFLLSLALPGTSTAGEGSYASNAKDLVAPERSSQSPTHTHTRTYTQPHTHNFSQSQSHTQNFSQSQARTNSDGFTTSLSFSQSLLHNLSCSLNCASVENQELSCGGSRQISQGNENFPQRSWRTASANEHHGVINLSHDGSRRRQENPLYQWALQNGNKHGLPSASGQKAQVDSKMLDLSRNDLEGFARPPKDLAGRSSQEEDAAWRFSAGRQTQSEPIHQREREKELRYPASPVRRKNEDARGDYVINGGKIGLQEITTEPVAVMAQMMQELPDSFLEGLKALAKDLLGSFEKREEFLNLQNIVKSRTDLTEHTLLHAHRTQLEILVAFKTGVQDFVREAAKPLTYKVLTEIFLQTRCRNITCQQSLPVDGCECKICSRKGGFCSECMCVVCSKFDSDNNTCRWVGCDVCMHWCHTDCGLRMSYVAPAQSNEGMAGGTEMQYRCVACGHHAELLGFVKKVFDQFANSWGAEILTRELDCVRRIFHGSEDMKGRELCGKVEEMLQKLEKNVETAEVRRTILQYFNEVNADWDGAGTTANKQSMSAKTNVATNRKPMAAQAATQVASRVGNMDVNKAHLMLQSSVRQIFTEKINETSELHVEKARKRPEIEDIHSRVRIKQAEANMLQRRADEAHQEAKGLQQIIIVKHKMIEDDYVCKYRKLRLKEAEEKSRKRFLEMQALERAHLDYEKIKLRMEAQIKDLAIKMEIANWQYA